MSQNPLFFNCLHPRNRFLVGLGRLPERFHALEPEILEPPALAGCQGFHGVESPFEFGVAPPEHRFRIHAELAGEVRAGEQDIAELIGEARIVFRVAR